MSAASGFDIRIPIGGLFGVVGAILVVYGIATGSDAALYERSLGVNINLWWGLAMLVFGVAMLLFGIRSMRAYHAQGVHPAAESPEGRATERLEHREGLERESSAGGRRH